MNSRTPLLVIAVTLTLIASAAIHQITEAGASLVLVLGLVVTTVGITLAIGHLREGGK